MLLELLQTATGTGLTTHPIILAIVGGAIHAANYGSKAYVSGEDIELIKTALTIALGGLVGLLFAIVGYQPTTEEWVFLLAAYAGFVGELESALKLLSRGYVGEAKDEFRRAGQSGIDVTDRIVAANAERIVDEVLERLPEESRPTPDESRRQGDTYQELNADTESQAQTSDATTGESADDRTPPTEIDDPDRRRILSLGWLLDDDESDRDGDADAGDTPDEPTQETVITDGP